jgi:hypothetical protein
MTPPITIKVDTALIERGFRLCPKIMAHHVKDGLEHVLNGFRKDFFRTTPVKLQTGPRGIGKPRFWPVRVTGGAKLEVIRGDLHTGSPAAFLQEVGGVAKPTGGRRKIAIPIGLALNKAGKRKPYYSRPSLARQRLGRKFVTIRTRRGGLILRQMVKARGRRKKGEAAREVLGGPAWLLVDQIRNRPLLGFIAQWEKGIPAAETRFAKNMEQAVDEAFSQGVNLRG